MAGGVVLFSVSKWPCFQLSGFGPASAEKSGMAQEEFFPAYDELLKRKISIRQIPSQVVADPEAEAFRLYMDAARRCVRLQHPNILTIYDIGLKDQLITLITENVEGRALLPGDLGSAWPLVPQLLEGLNHAHQSGVIHRQICLEAILLFPGDILKLWGFELALMGATLGEAPITMTEEVPDYAYFMAPEQARGDEVDRRTDIYSVGVLLYRIFAGQPPFPANSWLHLIDQLLSAPPAPIRVLNPEVPEGIAAAIHRCLEKEPAARFQNLRELSMALSVE